MSRLRSSGLPLYRQIYDALRYDIATGRLAPNERLTPLRAAAREWGVNLHTVRHAYAELAKEGLVESLGAAGTRVVGPPSVMETAAEIDRFIAGVRSEASDRFNLGIEELCTRLRADDQTTQAPPTVWFVECSHQQAHGHAAELEARWQVDARPFSLEQDGEPGSGAVLATFFHYNDIRRRWPHRLSEILFVAIRPDHQLLDLLGAESEKTSLTVCELDEMSARNIIADISVVLPPDRFQLHPSVVNRAADALRGGDGPILFSPRTWAALTPHQRTNERAIELRYEITPEQIVSLGSTFGWRPRL